jgi:hypothetical protein
VIFESSVTKSKSIEIGHLQGGRWARIRFCGAPHIYVYSRNFCSGMAAKAPECALQAGRKSSKLPDFYIM